MWTTLTHRSRSSQYTKSQPTNTTQEPSSTINGLCANIINHTTHRTIKRQSALTSIMHTLSALSMHQSASLLPHHHSYSMCIYRVLFCLMVRAAAPFVSGEVCLGGRWGQEGLVRLCSNDCYHTVIISGKIMSLALSFMHNKLTRFGLQ